MIEGMNEWMNGWINKWMNELMNLWTQVTMNCRVKLRLTYAPYTINNEWINE